jgi:hypothetical protein
MMREEYRAHLESVIKELSEKPADGMQPSRDVEDPGDTKKDEKPKDSEPRVKLHGPDGNIQIGSEEDEDGKTPTRVTHAPEGKPRGYEYTVVKIDLGSDTVHLRAGDGKMHSIDTKQFETEYVVD